MFIIDHFVFNRFNNLKQLMRLFLCFDYGFCNSFNYRIKI